MKTADLLTLAYHPDPHRDTIADLGALETELLDRARGMAERLSEKLARSDTFDVGSLAGNIADHARAAQHVRLRIDGKRRANA
jgi:hypothetical protein